MNELNQEDLLALGGKNPYTPPAGPNGTRQSSPGEGAVPPDRVKRISPAIRAPYDVWYKMVWVWLSSWVGTFCYTMNRDRIKQYNSLTQGLSAILLRAAEWWFMAPMRAWSMLEVLTGGKVSEEKKLAKDIACGQCPFRAYRMRRVYTRTMRFNLLVRWPILLGQIALLIWAFWLTFWGLVLLCPFVVVTCILQTWLSRRFATSTVEMDEYCGKCGCPDTILSRNKRRNWYRKWLCPVFKHEGPYPGDDLRNYLKALTPPKDKELKTGAACGCGKR